MDQRELLRRLTDMQYTRNELDLHAAPIACAATSSTSSRRNPSATRVRVELFDDEIESLMLFDPLTGEIKRKMPRFTVFPKHALRDAARAAAQRGRPDPRRAARRGCTSCEPRTSWSRRSASSSARASTWR